MVPSTGASTGISIFMDSSTITWSPDETVSPTPTTTFHTTPVTGDSTSTLLTGRVNQIDSTVPPPEGVRPGMMGP